MTTPTPRYTVEGFAAVDRKQAETLIYRHTHPYYRGSVEGAKTILVCNPTTGGTESWPMSALTDAQIANALPYALRKEAQRTAGRKA